MQYSGRTPPRFPSSVTIQADEAPPNAGAYNPGLQGVADGMYYLKALADSNKCVPVVTEFLGGASIAIPANALPWGLVDGCGQGGRGGVGANSSAQNKANSGGGGGGSAIRRCGLCPLVPGETYAIAVGDAFQTSIFGFGADGADTTLTLVSTSEVIVRLKGAAGGHVGHPGANAVAAGFDGEGNVNFYTFARGGRPVARSAGADLLAAWTRYATMYLEMAPQVGGLGTCSTWDSNGVNTNEYNGSGTPENGAQGTAGCAGNGSEAFDGGAGGTPGLHNGALGARNYGGGAGGGGAGGPWGAGGKGGNGSDAVSSGASSAPEEGADAPANSGAGGGGGGAAGGSSTPTTLGKVGGLGGSGRFYLVYFIPAVLT